MSDRPTTEPRSVREALDELAEAFPVDDISDAPWVVERGSITWMIREGENGPQVGNFILEADARWVAAARNAIEAEAAQGAAPRAEGRPERTNLPSNDEIRKGYRWAAPRAEGLGVEQRLDKWARDSRGITSIPTTKQGLDELLSIVEQARARLSDSKEPNDE